MVSERVLTADECRIGRAALGWSEADLARAALVTVDAVQALESASAESEAAEKIQVAFAEAGVTFRIAADGRSTVIARTLDGIIEAPVTLSRG